MQYKQIIYSVRYCTIYTMNNRLIDRSHDIMLLLCTTLFAYKKKKIAVLPVENLSMIRETNLAYHKDFAQMDILQDIVKAYRETLRLYQ